MRKRIFGIWLCLLALATGAVAQTQLAHSLALTREIWFPKQLQFTQNGERLLGAFDVYSDSRKKNQELIIVSWDTKSGRRHSQAVLPKAPYSQFAFSPDGKLYCSLEYLKPQPQLTMRETATGKLVSTIESSDTHRFPQHFSADGKLLARLNTGGKIEFWHTGSGKPTPFFDALGEKERFSHIFFSGDNRQFVGIGPYWREQKEVQQWVVIHDRFTGKRLKSFSLGQMKLYGFQLSPNGRYLASLGRRGLIHVWDTQTGELLHSLTLKPDPAINVRLHFSADGSQLMALTNNRPHDYVISNPGFWKQVWSTATGQELGFAKLPIETSYVHNGIIPTATASTAHGWFYAKQTDKGTMEIFSLD